MSGRPSSFRGGATVHPSVGDGVTWGKCRLKTLGRDRSPRREAAEAGTDRTLGSASARSVSSVLRRLRADSLPAGREPECEGPGSLDRPGLRRLLPPGRDQPGPRANLGSLATIRRHDRGPGRGADRPGLQWNLRRPGFRAHRLRSDRLCVHAHRALPDRGRDHRRSRLSDESHSPGAGKIAGTGNRGVSMTRRAVPPGSEGGELEGLADPSVAPCLARQSRLWTLDQRVTSSAEPGSSVLIHDA